MANDASPGTNLFVQNGAVAVSLTDENGNAIIAKGTAANIPTSVAGYAIGCLYLATDTGAVYSNTGTASSATFTQLAFVE